MFDLSYAYRCSHRSDVVEKLLSGVGKEKNMLRSIFVELLLTVNMM